MDLEIYEEVKGAILCRLYYKSIGGLVIKVYAPFNKTVYYVKNKDEMHGICEKLFKRGYFKGKHLNIFTEKVTPTVFARSVVYWLSRTGSEDEFVDESVKKQTVIDYLLPLLDKCKCGNLTKERYLVELDNFLSGKIKQDELMIAFSKRIIRLKKGFHIHKIKIA